MTTSPAAAPPAIAPMLSLLDFPVDVGDGVAKVEKAPAVVEKVDEVEKAIVVGTGAVDSGEAKEDNNEPDQGHH